MAKKSIGYELSKSTLIRSVQCSKSLYLYKYYSQLREKPDYSQQATFDRGHSVGYLAQQLFPSGKDLTPPSLFQWNKSALATQHYIQIKEPVMYEAAFIYRQTMVAVDMLVYNGTNWDIYEVKSSIKISETYLQDAAIQYYIAKNCGLDINRFYILSLNGGYVRKGELEVQRLFQKTDVTKEVISRERETISILDKAIDTLLAGNVPDVEIGGQCSKPYMCDFMQHCWGDKLNTSIFNFGSIGLDEKARLLNQGFETINNASIKHIHLHPNVAKAHLEKKEVFDSEIIWDLLSKLHSDLYFFDIEAFQPAIPLYDDSHPYENMPFLGVILRYSKETESVSEHILWMEFREKEDKRKEFLELFLENTLSPLPIVVYGRSFEKNVLNRLGNLFPEYKKDIEERTSRIVDLSEIFQKKHYYHPAMNGNYSLKSVAVALCPDIYHYSEVKDGREAAAMYEEYIYKPDARPAIARKLTEYCKSDTYALLEVWRHLGKLSL